MALSHEHETYLSSQNLDRVHSETLQQAGRVAIASTFEAPVPQTKPNLYLAIGNAPRNPDNNYIKPTPDQRSEIIRALQEFDGITPTSDYSETDVAEGVSRATELVESGESHDLLSQLKMYDLHDAHDAIKPLRISLEGEVAIDPRRVVEVGGLTNWHGVRYLPDGTLFKKYEEGASSGISRPSRELINDYATRSTQLPAVSEAEVYLTNEGMFARIHDSHRVAAAQLRHEPVRAKDIKLYDYRNQQQAGIVQLELMEGIKTANHNSAIE